MKIIAGPCQHESLQHSLKIADHCREVAEKYGFEYFFKASFDKANRSSDSGKRGYGFENTMSDFLLMKRTETDLKILTDVHRETHIDLTEEFFADAIDVYQIPAFLSRQTDLIKRACKTDKIVNIKKGQFLAPWDIAGVLSKTEGAKEVWITERGTSFGYNNLVVDFTGVRYMLEHFSESVVMDCTHAVQRPGGNGTSSGGNRDYAPFIGYAAAAVGVRDFFIEVHEDPDFAPSDGPNMIRLEDFEKTIENIYNIIKATE